MGLGLPPTLSTEKVQRDTGEVVPAEHLRPSAARRTISAILGLLALLLRGVTALPTALPHRRAGRLLALLPRRGLGRRRRIILVVVLIVIVVIVVVIVIVVIVLVVVIRHSFAGVVSHRVRNDLVPKGLSNLIVLLDVHVHLILRVVLVLLVLLVLDVGRQIVALAEAAEHAEERGPRNRLRLGLGLGLLLPAALHLLLHHLHGHVLPLLPADRLRQLDLRVLQGRVPLVGLLRVERLRQHLVREVLVLGEVEEELPALLALVVQPLVLDVLQARKQRLVPLHDFLPELHGVLQRGEPEVLDGRSADARLRGPGLEL